MIDDGKIIAEGTAAELKSSLGRSIVEVDFADTATAQRALPVLAPLGDASTLTTTVSIKVEDGSETLFAVVRALDAAAIPATNVVIREPSLDDVFLTLTGHGSESKVPA